jgi:hypothetical protein
MHRLGSVTAAVVALAFGAAALGAEKKAAPVKAKTTTDDLAVTGAPWVNVKSEAGALTVRAGGDGTVRVVTHRPEMSAADDAAAKVTVAQNKWGVVQIIYHYEGKRPAQVPSIDFEIQVPAASRLQLVTAGGAIDVDGTTGGVQAHTSGGAVSAHNLRGEVQLTTSGGAIRVDQINGQLAAQTSGGSITVIAGELRGVSSAITSGGSITFSLPAKSRLKVEALTTGGGASNDFGLGGGGSQFGGLIGDGGFGTLKLRTTGGNISLRKSG